MITNKRTAMAMRAIRCYCQQVYPHRELLVIDGGTDRLRDEVGQLGRNDIRYFDVSGSTSATLGELRNYSLSLARGSFFAQWDDDDWHAPERLSAQLAALRGADICFLKRWTLGWPEKRLFGYSHARAWEGSIVARREFAPSYAALRRGEDSEMVAKWMGANPTMTLLDAPDLYIYVYHGQNTWGVDHFAKLFSKPAFEPFDTKRTEAILARLRQ